MSSAAIMLTALAVDAGIGWPARMFRAIGHPVSWIGAMITRLESDWNRLGAEKKSVRNAGRKAALVTIFVATGIAWLVSAFLPDGLLGNVLTGILAAPFLATRSLYNHVKEVADPLIAGDLARGT